MKIVVASDISGLNLKEAVKKYLQDQGVDVTDVGQQVGGESITHINAARYLAKAIKEGAAEKGIIFCGTGAGASMCVNKVRGMYCVACESLFSAPKIALINNANVLAMGARIIGPENACEMAHAFLNQGFAADFAPERKKAVTTFFNAMTELENESFK